MSFTTTDASAVSRVGSYEQSMGKDVCIFLHSLAILAFLWRQDLIAIPIQKRSVFYHAKTLYLFTKSDFKSVIIPQAVFALAAIWSGLAAPPKTPIPTHESLLHRVPLALFWLWLHILVENMSNQRHRLSIEEDKLNKPWRPIPAGRISAHESLQVLKCGAIPVALLLSALLGVSQASATLMVCVWLYNDLDAASTSPILRNLVTASGIGCFGWGATTILLGSGVKEYAADAIMSKDGILWLVLNMAVVATTVHVSDFPDVVGDNLRGRKTLPLVWGERPARWSVAGAVLFWSLVCPAFVRAGIMGWMLVSSLGLFKIILVLGMYGQRADRWNWRLWGLWMIALYLLPLF